MAPRSALRQILLPVLAATACTSAAATPAEDGVRRDAAAMDEQQRRLDELGPARPSPPAWVDHEWWQSLIPDDNQPGVERVALGRALYFDLRLSADGTVSCASCHDVGRGFAERRATSIGIGGAIGRRNAPTILNAGLLAGPLRNGRAADLEEEALLSIVSPVEMGQASAEEAVRAIADDPRYQTLFHLAYGHAPNPVDLGRAIASFERSLIFLDAPFDRYQDGDTEAVSAAAQRGWALFNGRGGCAGCHTMGPTSPLGTNGQFHNAGVWAWNLDVDDLEARAGAILDRDASPATVDALALASDVSPLGRFLVTRARTDLGAFRTLPIRNVGITAPYMHDGSMATLWDVIDHHNKGGQASDFLDRAIEPLGLSEQEVSDLVELLFAMTDLRFASQNLAERERQGELAARERPFRRDDLAFRRKIALDDEHAGRHRRRGAPRDAMP